ncbi:MAG: glycoside hydrolase family 15 protein [Phycisphaerales bacterium]
MTLDRDFFLPFAAAAALVASAAHAQPTSIDHNPFGSLPTSNLNPANPFGGAPTQRSPLSPREDEAVTVFFRVGCQFTYSNAAIYLTTDGTDPNGNRSTAFGTTQIIPATFVANEFGGSCTRDWWRVTIPASARAYGQNVRYRVVAWNNSPVGQATGLVQSYDVKLAWPGQGSNFGGAHAIGYPPFHAWKEEGVVGNNFINAMLDQNGNIFDVYFPGAGGVSGVGTKNEGYVNGLDTFPAGLPLDNRGQMHFNQIITGIRAGGVTSWLSNQNGTDFTNVTQAYVTDTQTIRTTSRLVRGGQNIDITQYDFSPKGVFTPPNATQGILLKRMILRNNNPTTETVNVYMYMDPAINGGDQYDFMLADSATGAMIAGDNTYRVVTNTGSIGFGQEYNPTTFSGYEKNISLFFAASMKTAPAVGAAGGARSTDTWRDSSGDNGQGWIGQKVTLPPGQDVEVSFVIVGGFERPAGRDAFAGMNGPGVFNTQMRQAIEWFHNGNPSDWQAQTDTYWQNFLNSGVLVNTPDASINALFRRGLLATMLHFDERNGGLIAGFRNGAYPYVWPRDMAWAGVTLARTGHNEVVRSMTRFLRDITYRDFENWTGANTPGFAAAGGSPFFGSRKGFWKQKYTTDGYTVWGAPQVDETAVIPWMVYYNFLVEGDTSYLTESHPANPANSTYAIVFDAAIAMSQTSTIDGSRLNHRAAYPGSSAFLMYSNNIWEDQYDTFIYSNANIVRGLRDAANIANVLGLPGDAANFTNRANGILAGLNAKLDWNGENTDISLLGIVYPFETHSPVDARAVRVMDRINGVAPDRFGAFEPLVRFANQHINNASDWVDLIDRYWGDSYWGNSAAGPTTAGPWFLTTLWYGVYYAMRQDYNPGSVDIDNHYYRINRTKDHNGPIGFGAEQMAPSNSLLYPGQPDFTLQTAWPNAWESMSFYVDAIMMFLDFTPDAPGNTLRIEPKLPTAWNTMTFQNLHVGSKRIDATISKGAIHTHTFTNRTGEPVNVDTVIRIDAGVTPCLVLVNGQPVAPTSVDTNTGRVRVQAALADGFPNAVTTIRVYRFSPADIANTDGDPGADGAVDNGDFTLFFAAFFSDPTDPLSAFADIADTDGNPGSDATVDNGDFTAFFTYFFGSCQ